MSDWDWSKTEILLLVIVIVVGIMLILQIVVAFIASNLAAKITKPIDDASKFITDVVNSIPAETREELSDLGVELSKDAGELAGAAGQYIKANKSAFKSLLSDSTAAGVKAIQNLPAVPTTISGVKSKIGSLATSSGLGM